MKRTIRKRILSGLLAVMMIVSNVNVSTYAAEDGQIVHEQELEADLENVGGNPTDEVTENTGAADEEQNNDDASQEQNDSESAESKDTDAAESKESEKETETQEQSKAETSAESKENTSTAETSDTKTPSSADSKNESSAAETQDSSKDKQSNAGGAGSSGLSTGQSTALTTPESTTAESMTAAEGQTTLAETLAEEVDSSPVNLSAQDSVKIRYSVNKWWILCEKGLSTDAAADGDELDFSAATEEYKQSVTGTRKRKDLLADSENKTESTAAVAAAAVTKSEAQNESQTESKPEAQTQAELQTDSASETKAESETQTAAQTSEKENAVETTNVNTSESSVSATESSADASENPTVAADTESTAENEASKDSEKNQFVEVYNFGQYNYAPSMTMGFDVSFSLNKKYSVKKETENSESGKTVTETVSREVKASDYLTFTLPKELTNLSIELPEDAYYTYETEALDSGETKVTVTLGENVPDTEKLTGKLHLTFTIDNEVLEAGEGTCEIVLFGKTYQLVFSGETAIAETADIGYFEITGSIDFDEQLGDINWKDIVRSSVFSLPIQLIQHYTDDEGEKTKTITTQENNSSADCYLKFANDGEGGGDFTITNVPKSVTVRETTDEETTNKNYPVTYYEVKVDTEKLPYYSNTAVPTENIADTTSQAIVTLKLTLNSQMLTLQPTVSPADESDNTAFQFNVSFTNPNNLDGKAVSSKKIEKKYTVTAGQSQQITVPLNMRYSVTQTAAEGYRLDSKYAVNGGVYPTTKDQASGIIYRDVTITTTNYNQNRTYPFLVYWVDNANKNRPSVSAENFRLQYRVTSSDIPAEDWTDLTSDTYEDLNIDSAPTYDASTAQADNKYYYKKLPSADKDGKAVEYRVVPVAPDGYVATTSTKDGTEVITFEEQLNFEATIYWNDRDYSKDRPSVEQASSAEQFKLYRRTGTSDNYVLVTDCNLTIKDVSGTGALDSWSVKAENLPRYDANNNEYDYVLVQGTIGDGNEITAENFENYKAHYNNAKGTYGNDTSLCHNGGYITEVLQATTTFNATKVWKDSGSSSAERPTATVTLWRYSKGTADNIDDAYANGKAAQVIFLTYETKDGKQITTEHIASEQLKGDTRETISSDHLGGYSLNLSKYDDQGREYVYFVRETLSGDRKDEYETHYSVETTDAEGNVTTTTYKNGAPTGGTITNVRRKKEAVTVTKIWKNPSGLSGIDGISVQAEIWASADNGTTYEPLTVYSDTQNSYTELTGEEKVKAQTISGFTSTIAQSEKTYYVNTYDSEGEPYDMTTARIVETVIGKDGKTKWTSSSSDIEKGDTGTKLVTDTNGNQYSVSTKYTETSTLAGGMKQYRYTQTNTITATRDYTLIKQWADSITAEEFQDISSIKFTLERRSTKDNADGTQASYSVVRSDEADGKWIVPASDGRTWTLIIQKLPKYDEDGYEYYYRATEVSFVKTDGTEMTVEAARKAVDNGGRNWSQNYYRTPDQTKVVNHIPSPGGGYFTASKIWRDNGDSDKRGDVVLRVYSREQLKAALASASNIYTSNEIVNLDSLQYNGADLKYYEATLKKNNQYTEYITFADIDRELGISTNTSDSNIGGSTGTSSNRSLKDYVVFEYEVKDAGVVSRIVNAVKAVLSSITGSEDTNGAKYTYAQLCAAADSNGGYSLSGTVSNSDRQYNTTATANAGDNTLMITNTRTGITSLDVKKTWEDDGNREKRRAAEISFQLYRDGSAYTNIPSTVTATASNITKDGQTFASCKVALDNTTGVITVSAADGAENTADQWSFHVDNLDMFSETAVPYIYNMDELADSTDDVANDESGRQFSYTQKKQDVESKDDGKTQTFSFDFVNTISGTTDHVAYKYWKDASIGAGNRPDLYLKLWRCLKSDYENAVKAAGGSSSTENAGDASEGNTSSGTVQPSVDIAKLDSCVEYKDYKDQLWTREDDNKKNGVTDYEEGYNWRITVEDLPMFDENGHEYIYFFTETMNNGGETVLGTYSASAVTKKLANGNTYEVFTNTVTDEMRVTGRKTWSGLSNYQTTELPDPVITLFRTTSSDIVNLQGKTDAEIKSLEENGSITEVDKTFLTGSTGGAEENDKTVYAFPNTTGLDPETHETVTENKLKRKVSAGLFCKDAGGNYMLPKFDSEGNRYTYLVRETISDNVASQLYNEINVNGTLLNKFRDTVNRRKITVTKNWDRTNVDKDEKGYENQYPSVTFTLYRYEAGTDSSKAVEIEKHTINSNEFKDADGDMKSASYTFKDLLVYSPTGAQYFYYIKETGINGYSIQYTDEDSITKTEDNPLLNTKVHTGTDADGTPKTVTITQSMLDELRTNDRIDVISLPENWNVEGAEPETKVSTTNTYVKTGTIKISGSKVWNDYHNFAGLRPASASDIGLRVTLTRSTGNESGQSNKVNSTIIALKQLDAETTGETQPYIVWNYGVNADNGITATNSDKWTYNIYNLPKYAANGMPYTYTLSESALVEGYADKASASADAGSADNAGNVDSKKNMVNQYSGSYTVRKNWYDGGNKYGLRPTDVTIVLQRASSSNLNADASDNSWSEFADIPLEENQVGTTAAGKNSWIGGYPSVVTENGKKIISVHLTVADVAANTNGNTWQYTFTNLPTIGKDSNGNTVKYKYQCIETQIGGIDVKTSYDVSSAGAYTRQYESPKESEKNSKTIIGNTLSSKTELTVTKQWDSDLDDYYYSRPTEITFKLQRKSNKSGSTWTDVQVTGSDGNETAYTFTIGKADGWTKTLTDLPGIEVEEQIVNGETVHKQYAISYRAVEIHTDGQSATSILKTLTAALTGTESTVVDGAQNYEDITSYSDIPSDGSSTGSDAAYESQERTITNRLRVDAALGSISVTKKWYTTNTEAQTAVFELLYKEANDTSDTWHCYADIAVPSSDDGDWSKHAQAETTGNEDESSNADSADKQCRVKTITATPEIRGGSTADYYAEGTCTWSNLPKYDRGGNALTYKVVEHPVTGYTTYSTATKTKESDLYAKSYTFTNVENQSYSVKKVWDIPSDAVSYAEKLNGKFTATFKLQQKTSSAEGWTDVADISGNAKVKVSGSKTTGYRDITLTNTEDDVASKKKTGTWLNLPKYDENGNQLIYRAVETEVNSKDVKNDTNGAYVASYKYGSGNGTSDRTNDSQFGDTMTTVTNRMVYGFVNLTKKAAYLAEGGITADTGNGSLQGVSFNIYKVNTDTNTESLYVSGVKTDANGNLINTNGKYGTEGKYLVAGTYSLKEASSTAGTGYSVWANGISFTIDSGGTLADQTPQTLGKTGEHGTAWISTSGVGNFTLGLEVQYKAAADVNGATVSTHSLDDGCVPSGTSDAAYDLESRGVLSFTKVGEKSTNSEGAYNDLDVHSDATGENAAYFGVYLDEDCTQQVAGMVPKATRMAESEKPGANDWRTIVLTNKTLDGAELTVYETVTLDTNGAASISSASNIPSSDDGSSKTYKIPYLRKNWVTNGTNDTTKDYPYTLLAGTYYIKELRAPAGYRLDTTVRKAVVDELKITAEVTTDLKTSYVDNNAKLSMVGSSEAASNAYKWSNNPTVVTLYKLDQFGQNVSLAENGYLTLTISGAGNSSNNAASGNSNETGDSTFPNGAETIRLYQNAVTPAKWFGSDGREISNVTNSYITYNSADGNWTIKGLLDAGRTYTLKEPESSVDVDHNIAASITFSVNADGKISVQNTDGTGATIAASEAPLTANGNDVDQLNCYNSDADNNQIVMRDTTNYRKDLVLQKEDSDKTENAGIANIYFKLYKYTNVDENGEPTDAVDVLGKDDGNEIYLETDKNGKIQLSTMDASIKNQTITDPKNAEEKLALKYGLDVGKYYLQEVEGGASDQYKLADKLYFEIKKDTVKTAVNSYNEYATVVLTGSTATDNHVSVVTNPEVNNGVTTITLKNDPVHNKTLVLTKVDSNDASKKLAGAKFTLSYVSANVGHEGAAENWTKNCITGNDGLLYLEDTEGAATTAQPDISAKGTYTLKETKSAAGYMTRAGEDGLTILTFKVDTNNQITDVKCYDAETGRLIDTENVSADNMVTAKVENSTEEGQTSEHKNLKVTVKNESTKVSAQIFSDIAKSNATKSCDQKDLTGEDLYGTHLEIYKGTETGIKASASNVAVLSGDKQNGWSWKNASGTAGDGTYLPAGTLKENTIYTLHESGAPVGYMAGEDIYFTLSGTTTQKNAEGENETVSQLYVWIGDGTPNANNAADTNLADDTKWSKLTNVKDNVLTMVDEAIIAPVDLQKVLASVDRGSFKALSGAEFEVAVRNTAVEGAAASAAESKTVLGTAVTTEKGYLVWKSITEAGYKYGRIFNAKGTRVSAANKDTAIGKTIVLQQNAEGYVFTETKAPDTAYNDGLSFHVQITEENYLEYRTVTGTGEAKTLTYHTDKYINLVEAEKNTKSDIPYSVKNEAERSSKTEYKDADGLAVNKEYQSTVTLHKYDASANGKKEAIAETEFTLYRDSVSKDNTYGKAYIVEKEGDDRKTTLNKSGVFTTDANGDITIEIREKGTYILKETKASAGYVLDDANLLTFVLKDEAETQSLTVNGGSAPVYGYGTTVNVLKKDENGVPNLREEIPVTPAEPETQPETQPETKPETKPETQPETESSSESHKGTSSGSHGGGSGGGSSVSSMHAVIAATEAESQTVPETVAETASESVGSGSSGGTSGGEAAEYDPDGDVKNARRNKNRNGKYGKNGKKTGDSQKPVIWISLICGAAALVGGVEFFERRKKKKQDKNKQ